MTMIMTGTTRSTIDLELLRRLTGDAGYGYYHYSLVIHRLSDLNCDKCDLPVALTDSMITAAYKTAEDWWGSNWRMAFEADQLEWRCLQCTEAFPDED